MGFIYFDTETTGLKPGAITQLAFIREDSSNNIIETSNEFFKVPTVYEASALDASKITGLTPELLENLSGGQTFYDKAEYYFEVFSGGSQVAHNIKFDEKFLKEELSRCGFNLVFSNPIDTMQLFRPICKIPKAYSRGSSIYKNPKLSEVAEYYNMNFENVLAYAKKLFADTRGDIDYHDARFDTTVMYVACKLRGEEMNGYGEYHRVFVNHNP